MLMLKHASTIKVECMRSFFLFVLCFACFGNLLAQQITGAEYFIDNDPGIGNGTPVSITPGTSINSNFTINTTALTSGFHTLGVRTKQSPNNVWSITTVQAFYIVPPNTLLNATLLTEAEWFIDNDPGFGNATNIPFTAANSINLNFTVPTNALTPGFHNLYVRTKDNNNRWAIDHIQTFYSLPPTPAVFTETLVAAEYFFNTDPGQGNGTPLTITANANQNNTFLIPVTSLPVGFNRLYVRYKNNTVPARWSLPHVQTFYVTNLANLPTKNITELEYYIDTDPGFNNATPITIVPAGTIDQNVAIDLTAVPTGNHLLSVRAKDNEGFWSEVVSEPFTISACIPPAQPTVANQTRCGEGTVTFTASGAGANQVYGWYADALTNTPLFSGDTYTTPLLTANEDYFVSIFDNSTSCESARRQVTATLTLLAKPTISPSGSISICEGSSIFLTAPQGFSQYQWSNGANASQILVTTTGNYTVQTGDGTCLSQASDPVTVTVTPAPTKPIITVTGNTTICGSGSVELSGPAGFQYLWSTGATSQTITVNQTSVIFLTVRTASNCPSFPSDPIVVTVLQPPCGGTNQPPVFNNTPASTTIEGKVSLDLTERISDPDNNLDFSTLRLVNALTTRGAPASISTDFELIIDYDNLPFTGTDRVVIEVCDLSGACIQQILDIEVVGALEIFNGLSPNGDGINDIFLLKYIDVVEGAAKNKVNIFNRWGDLVFDVKDYNNTDRVFKGESNSGRELPSGTYFYTIEFESGLQSIKGYITLIR